MALAVRLYVTAVPETDGVLTVAPAVTAVRVAPTTAGTEDERVVTIADAVPTVMVLTGAVDALEGHTRMLVEGTVTTIRRRVGVTINVNVVALAAPEYVAENEPLAIDVLIALNVPLLDSDTALGITEPALLLKVTGTTTVEPDTSVIPDATRPNVALVASNATTRADERSVVVKPSGAVAITENRTEPELGAVEPSV